MPAWIIPTSEISDAWIGGLPAGRGDAPGADAYSTVFNKP